MCLFGVNVGTHGSKTACVPSSCVLRTVTPFLLYPRKKAKLSVSIVYKTAESRYQRASFNITLPPYFPVIPVAFLRLLRHIVGSQPCINLCVAFRSPLFDIPTVCQNALPNGTRLPRVITPPRYFCYGTIALLLSWQKSASVSSHRQDIQLSRNKNSEKTRLFGFPHVLRRRHCSFINTPTEVCRIIPDFSKILKKIFLASFSGQGNNFYMYFSLNFSNFSRSFLIRFDTALCEDKPRLLAICS